jgi:DNA-binding NarL/FixJ family response regulator
VDTKRAVSGVSTRAPDAVGLTRRQRHLVNALLDGCSNKAIAARFGLSDHTVSKQLTGLYASVGVSSRVELAMWAIREKPDLS